MAARDQYGNRKKSEPYVPVTTNTNWFKGVDPVQRQFTGEDASQDQRQAYNLVESQFGPQRVAQQQQLSQLGRDRQHETQQQEAFGEKHGQSLQEISAELQRQLGGVTDRTQQLHSGASNVINDAYGRAQQSTQGASDDVLGALSEQMQRLGLTEAGTDPNRDLSQIQTDMSGRHAISGAGAVGNAEALGANMSSIAALRQGDAAQEWAGKQEDLGQQVMANVQMINKEYGDSRNEVFSQIQALEQARGQALSSTLYDVIEQRLERERQTKLDALSEEMARRGMAVQEGYLKNTDRQFGLDAELGRGGLDIQRGQLDISRGDLDIKREQLGLQRQQLEEEIAQANSPAERRRAELELMILDSQLGGQDASNLAQELANMGMVPGGEGMSMDDLQGWTGMQSYLQNQPSLSTGDQSRLWAEFNQMLTRAAAEDQQSAVGFDTALRTQINSPDLDPSVKPHMQAMYEIYNKNF